MSFIYDYLSRLSILQMLYRFVNSIPKRQTIYWSIVFVIAIMAVYMKHVGIAGSMEDYLSMHKPVVHRANGMQLLSGDFGIETDDLEKWTIKLDKEVGHGAFGEVYDCSLNDPKGDTNEYVVKIVPQPHGMEAYRVEIIDKERLALLALSERYPESNIVQLKHYERKDVDPQKS